MVYGHAYPLQHGYIVGALLHIFPVQEIWGNEALIYLGSRIQVLWPQYLKTCGVWKDILLTAYVYFGVCGKWVGMCPLVHNWRCFVVV